LMDNVDRLASARFWFVFIQTRLLSCFHLQNVSWLTKMGWLAI